MKKGVLRTSTFLVIFFVYVFSIFAWISIQSFHQLVDRWSHNSEMTVYLRPEVTEENIRTLNALFAGHSDEVTAVFQSSEAIRSSLKKIMPRATNDFSTNDDIVAAIPPHFILKGQGHLLGDSLFQTFQSIKKEISPFSFVESAGYGKTWSDRYASILASVRGTTVFFLFGLSLALIMVIGNTIRSHVNGRREEIEILELVGATQAMVRKPFLIEGTLLSTVAMALALLIGAFTVSFIKGEPHEMVNIIDLKTVLWQISLTDSFIALLLSASIGFVGSYLCLSEINTGWAATGYHRKITHLLQLVNGKKGFYPHG